MKLLFLITMFATQTLIQNWIYTNTVFSYSISLSNDWKQIPASEIDRVSKLAGIKTVYNEGFYKNDIDKTNNYFSYPYVLTQIHLMDTKENEYDYYAELLIKNQNKIKEGFDETKEKFSAHIEKIEFNGKAFYNKNKHRIYIPFKAKQTNEDEIFGCMIMIIFQKGFFQINLYSDKLSFFNELDNIELTLDSFKSIH